MSAAARCGEPMIMNSCRGLLALLVVAVSLPCVSAEESFPFGAALMLDAAPMRGSKRIPMIEIAENGAASIDLWCATARAQAVVADHSISIAPADVATTQCEPERQSRDTELLAALAQVTNWRRKGEVVELLGITPLRFRLMTN
jgi:META domain